jgi:hypothetical protein
MGNGTMPVYLRVFLPMWFGLLHLSNINIRTNFRSDIVHIRSHANIMSYKIFMRLHNLQSYKISLNISHYVHISLAVTVLFFITNIL